MNKKGFTLIELLVVLSIVSILMTLSFFSYVKVKNIFLERQFENKMELVYIAAEKYVNDYKISMDFTVDDLIQNKYLEPDKDGIYFNPVDNTSMNCYLIKVDENEDIIIEKNDYNEYGVCKNDPNYYNLDIYCNGSVCNKDSYSESIIFTINNIDAINSSDVIVNWTNEMGLDKTEKFIEISSKEELSFNLKAKVKYDDKFVFLQKKIYLNTTPVDDINTSIIKENDKYYLKIVSNRLSGNLSYSLTKGSCMLSVLYDTSNVIEIDKNGYYNVCVKDEFNGVINTFVDIKQFYYVDEDIREKVFYINSKFSLKTPKKEGYSFLGWYNGNKEILSSEEITNDSELIAKYKKLDIPIKLIKKDSTTFENTVNNKFNLIFVTETTDYISTSDLVTLKSIANDIVDKIDYKTDSKIAIIKLSNIPQTYLSPTGNITLIKEKINTLSGNGIPSIDATIKYLNQFINSNFNNEKDHNYVIFLTNGKYSVSNVIDLMYLKTKVNKVLTIGLNSNSDYNNLESIASNGYNLTYLNYIDEINKLFSIEENVLEETLDVNSENGKVILYNLDISDKKKLLISVNNKEYIYSSITEIKEFFSNNVLNLESFDKVNNLNGKLDNMIINYYYKGGF